MVAVTSTTGQGVAVVEPTPVTFELDEWLYIPTVCTEATVDATTWYWNGTGWTTDPAAWCGRPFGLFNVLAELPSEVQPWVAYLRCQTTWGPVECGLELSPVWDRVDPVVCSVLAAHAPGEPGAVDIRADGDVYVADQSVWDCPPYQWR